MKTTRTLASTFLAASLTIVTLLQPGQAAPLPGGTLDPTTIPKYVIPLVYPPVMKNNGQNRNDYHIALRQFQQQILPGGPWNAVSGREDNFPATTVWSYGPAYDPLPEVAPDPSSGFNYPAYTIETLANLPVSVKWINGLVDENGDYLPHLLPIDQTIHWANPPATDCKDGSNRTDCGTNNPRCPRAAAQ
jgi:spore coat protein A